MVFHIPIQIDGSSETTLKQGGLKVLLKVKSQWQEEDIKFKIYTNGITNRLIGAWTADPNDQVLIRVYGEKTEDFIDRKAEVETMLLLNKHDCGPTVYAQLENGICYGFVPGTPPEVDDMTNRPLWRAVAKAMAELHLIKVDKTSPELSPRLNKFYHLIPETLKPEFESRLREAGISKSYIREQLDTLIPALEALGCPIVFCHNDILIQNIVWNAKTGRAHLIDVEYAFVNYQAYDIGNHFDEFAGMDNLDYARYPSREFQLEWIRCYLSHYLKKPEDQIEDSEVHKWMVWANKFALAAHLFWGLWAMVQALNSSIDWDFFGYSITRISEYKRRKEEFLALSV